MTTHHVPSTILPTLHPKFHSLLSTPYEMGIIIPILERKLKHSEGNMLKVAQLVKMKSGPNKDPDDLSTLLPIPMMKSLQSGTTLAGLHSSSPACLL